MNANAFHNILNYLGLLVALICMTDLTDLGFSPTTAALVAPWFLLGDKVIKLTINYFRDGASGMFRQQPPVE